MPNDRRRKQNAEFLNLLFQLDYPDVYLTTKLALTRLEHAPEPPPPAVRPPRRFHSVPPRRGVILIGAEPVTIG